MGLRGDRFKVATCAASTAIWIATCGRPDVADVKKLQRVPRPFRDRNSPYPPANRLQALRVCCSEACDCCRHGIAGCNRRKLQRVPGPLGEGRRKMELRRCDGGRGGIGGVGTRKMFGLLANTRGMEEVRRETGRTRDG